MKIKNPLGFSIVIFFIVTSAYYFMIKDWRMGIFYLASGIINIVIVI